MMPNCKEMAFLLSEGLDHRLPLIKRLLLKIHLMMCKACKNYKRQMFALRILSRVYFKSLERFSKTPSDSLSEISKKKMKARLREELS